MAGQVERRGGVGGGMCGWGAGEQRARGGCRRHVEWRGPGSIHPSTPPAPAPHTTTIQQTVALCFQLPRKGTYPQMPNVSEEVLNCSSASLSLRIVR